MLFVKTRRVIQILPIPFFLSFGYCFSLPPLVYSSYSEYTNHYSEMMGIERLETYFRFGGTDVDLSTHPKM